jgi:UPF0755 protein
MNQKVLKLLAMILPPLVAGLISYSMLKSYFLMPAQPAMTAPVIVEIAQGKGLSHIAADLKDRGMIKSILVLRLLARMTGGSNTIQAGEYELSGSMTPKEILRKLTSGEIKKRRVLIKEGATLWDIASSLDEAGVMKKEDFLHSATDESFLKKTAVTAPSFEGYLFPSTYFFSRPVEPEAVIWQMFDEAEKKWTEEYSKQIEILGFGRHEILTLASMIQKEAGNESEMPIISSVFHNRIKQGMKLQCDSTVIYGIKNFNGNITKIDLETDTPYNTYTRIGLPVGPISNPGEKAVRAALFPRATSYLYFVANGKGEHIFSENLKDHNAAVLEYQIKPAQNDTHEAK